MKICPAFGKKDIVFLVTISILSMLIYGMILSTTKSGGEIKITIDGKAFGIYELNEDQTIPITIDGGVANTVVIQNGKASMQSATCPDGLCKKQGQISRQKQTIVCLPHKVVVEVISGKETEGLDAIAS